MQYTEIPLLSFVSPIYISTNLLLTRYQHDLLSSPPLTTTVPTLGHDGPHPHGAHASLGHDVMFDRISPELLIIFVDPG